MANYTTENACGAGPWTGTRVVVNDTTRARDGQTGEVISTKRNKYTESGWGTVVKWDDGHYPSSEDTTSLAPAT